MRLMTWGRLFIIALMGFGLGTFPRIAGAQDNPIDDLEPPSDAASVSLGAADEAAEQELSSIHMIELSASRRGTRPRTCAWGWITPPWGPRSTSC